MNVVKIYKNNARDIISKRPFNLNIFNVHNFQLKSLENKDMKFIICDTSNLQIDSMRARTFLSSGSEPLPFPSYKLDLPVDYSTNHLLTSTASLTEYDVGSLDRLSIALYKKNRHRKILKTHRWNAM